MLEITVIADRDLGLVAMMTHVTPATKNNIQKATIDKSMIQNWKLKNGETKKIRRLCLQIFRSKYLHEKTCEKERGTKRKGVKKSNYRARTRVEIHLSFSIFALNYFKNIMII